MDRELVASARSGDKEAFGKLIERQQPACLRLAMSLVNDRETAREIVQEAVLQAYLSLDDLREDAKFGNWLLGIVANLCRDQRRKHVHSPLVNSTDEPEFAIVAPQGQDQDPLAAAEEREVRDLIAQALDTLPSRSRAAARLFYVEGRNLREVADALRVSVGAVKGRLYRARELLKDRLLPLSAQFAAEHAVRRKEPGMIQLTIADVVMDQEKPSCVVVLHDQVGQHLLPIWIGEAEGLAIAMGLRGHDLSRPMTHDLMAKLVEAIGATVERVRIESLRDTTFYAVVELRAGRKLREVDARPSDALALAVRLSAPVVATEEVMERIGVAIPPEHRDTPPAGRGIDAIVAAWEQKTVRSREDELQRLVAFVFGGGISRGGQET